MNVLDKADDTGVTFLTHTILPAQAESCVPAQLDARLCNSTVLVESTCEAAKLGFLIASTLVECDSQGQAYVRVMNPHKHDIPVSQGTRAARATRVTCVTRVMNRVEELRASSHCQVVQNEDSASSEEERAPPRDDPWNLPPHLHSLFERSSVHMHTSEQKQRLADILNRYSTTFVRTSAELGLSKVGEHVIDTGNAEPIKDQPRRIPLGKRQAVVDNVKTMLETGVIRESNSPWSACPVLVTKPDGSLRWCVDWRRLNSVTVKDSYPMPRVEDCLDALSGSCLLYTSPSPRD